ncbi:hypothetical protein [Chelativorans alearense]|uniref:hypothetical protein n=1 Tax=Chelativorans alearense TaxID=2681495 RepID=UPI0013D8736A|nr:hypothetical protein [Chelativorans alearense]
MFCLRLSFSVAVLATVGVYPLAQILPNWTAWENQPVENVGSLVLLVGMVAALLYQHRSEERKWKWLWRAAAPLWLILLARELSWGAVFYPPTQMTNDGPIFSSDHLWYKPVVYPLVALIGVAVVYIVMRHRLVDKAADVIRAGAAPWLEALLALICVAVATIAEGHGGVLNGWIGGHSMLIEELAELAAALWLFAGQARVRAFQLKESRTGDLLRTS